MSRLLTDRRDVAAAVPSWTQAHEVSGSTNPFAHPAWCRAWWESRPRTPLRLLLDDAGCTVLPLVAAHADPRRWQTLGTPLVDFADPVLPGGDAGADRLVDLLDEHRARWRSVTFTGLDEDLAAAVVERSTDRVRFTVVAREPCPRLALTPGGDPAASRRSVRRARRELGRLGEVRCGVVEKADEIGRAVRDFDVLRLESWWSRGRIRELHPAVRDARHHTMLTRAATSLADEGLASVAELRLDGRLLAATVLYWTPTTVLIALKATDVRPGWPGLVLDAFVLDLARERGVDRVDFGLGAEDYKFRLGADAHTVSRVVATQGRGRGPLLEDRVRRVAAGRARRWRMLAWP